MRTDYNIHTRLQEVFVLAHDFMKVKLSLMALFLFNAWVITLISSRSTIANRATYGTVETYSCKHDDCLPSDCYRSHVSTYDDMDGTCHESWTLHARAGKIGYTHVCVNTYYYATQYEVVECDDIDGHCWCGGRRREIGATKGCALERNPLDPDYPYQHYICSYGQHSDPSFQSSKNESGDTLNAGVEWYMYVIGIIVALIVFILGIFGRYRCWMRQKKQVAMSTDLLDQST